MQPGRVQQGDEIAEREQVDGPHDTKTEVVRQVLPGETDRETHEPDLVTRSIAFAHELREQAGPNPQPVDAAFRDGLYKDS